MLAKKFAAEKQRILVCGNALHWDVQRLEHHTFVCTASVHSVVTTMPKRKCISDLHDKSYNG